LAKPAGRRWRTLGSGPPDRAGHLRQPVQVPTPGEYVALGAARQAAWVLSRADSPPRWLSGATESFIAAATPEVLDQYREAQPLTLGQP
jgi:xylulokinase